MNKKDELKHFGVKGMKWGVWNEETRARRSGTKKDRKKNKDEHYYKLYKTYKYLAQQANSNVSKGNSLRKASNMASAASYMRKADKALKKIDPDALKEFKRQESEERKKLKQIDLEYRAFIEQYNNYLKDQPLFTPVMNVNSFLDVYKDMKWDPDEHRNDPDFEEQEREIVTQFLNKYGATAIRVKGE